VHATYLPIRLASQRVNLLRWSGTCNVTALAMALSHVLPADCSVSADGLFALLGVAFQNEKLLKSVKQVTSVTRVNDGLLRSGDVENPHELDGIVRTTELVNPSPGYMANLLPRLGKEQPYEADDGGPKGRIRYAVTDEALYKNIWYKAKVRRAKGKPAVRVLGGYLERKGQWDGSPDLEQVNLVKEFNRVPLGVMRINLYADALRETGRIVAGMAAAHKTIWLGVKEEGRPLLRLGNIEHDLSHGAVAQELVQEMSAYRDYGKKWVKDAPSQQGAEILERIRANTIAKKVAIISGRFTHGGHFVVACGYVEEEGEIVGIVVADPWGKGSYEDTDGTGARDYSDKKSDALCVYEAESFVRAYKYTAAEFMSLGGGVSVRRGSVRTRTVGSATVVAVAPIATA
jgi:hypothetical protein